MLLNKLFTFDGFETDENLTKINVKFNPEHPIFKGHFPDQPILPGVCMMQIVKEAVEAQINKETKLVKANDMKFLSFVDPNEKQLVQLELKLTFEDGFIKTDARLMDNELALFKFKGSFSEK